MEAIVQYLAPIILGISAVGAFISKAQVARKYLSLAAEVITFIDELLKATEDGELSSDEIKKLSAESKEIKEAFKKIKNK